MFIPFTLLIFFFLEELYLSKIVDFQKHKNFLKLFWASETWKEVGLDSYPTLHGEWLNLLSFFFGYIEYFNLPNRSPRQFIVRCQQIWRGK